MEIRNASSDDAILSNIRYVPACATISGTTCTKADAGVFTISNPQPGPDVLPPADPNACGTSLGGISASTVGGVTTFTHLGGPPVIGPPGHDLVCEFTFDVAVVAAPPAADDTDTSTPGIQINQLATAHFTLVETPEEGDFKNEHTTTFPVSPGKPMFVIGDLEPHGVGSIVNFWGSQWWQNNFMSKGYDPGTASFKGFADNGGTDCGQTWTTRTGNSSKPPDTIPPDILVIVTDTVTKNGSVLGGTIKQIVSVHQDGNYGVPVEAPGHRGAGPVTQIVCSVQ